MHIDTVQKILVILHAPPLYPSPCNQRQRESTLEAMTSQRRFRPLFAFFLPATTLNGNQEPTNSSL